MWHKAHPVGLRVGIIKSRASERIAKDKKQSQQFFIEDIQIRNFVDTYYKRCGISKVVVRKTAKEWEVILFTAKVGLVMWKNGEKIKTFEELLKKKFKKPYKVNVKTIKSPELSARIMAEFIATQLEARMPFRKVARSVLQKVMERWAMGVKVSIGWRLWGVDIARTEKFSEGRIPLQTLRADIDYHVTIAMTKYGVIGIKVRIAKGEVFGKRNQLTKRKIMQEIDV